MEKMTTETKKEYKPEAINELNKRSKNVYQANANVPESQLKYVTTPGFIYRVNVNAMYADFGKSGEKPVRDRQSGGVTYQKSETKFHGVSLRYDDDTKIVGIAKRQKTKLDNAVERGSLSTDSVLTQVAYFNDNFDPKASLGDNAYLAYSQEQSKLLNNADHQSQDFHMFSPYLAFRDYFQSPRAQILNISDRNGGISFNWGAGKINSVAEQYLVLRKVLAEGYLNQIFNKPAALMELALNDFSLKNFNPDDKLSLRNFNYAELAQEIKAKNITTIRELMQLITTYETSQVVYLRPKAKVDEFALTLKRWFYNKDDKKLHNFAALEEEYKKLGFDVPSLADLIKRLANPQTNNINVVSELENIKKFYLNDELKNVKSKSENKRHLTNYEAGSIVLGLQNILAYNIVDEAQENIINEYDQISRLNFEKQNSTGQESTNADNKLTALKTRFVHKNSVLEQVRSGLIDNNYFFRQLMSVVGKTLQENFPQYDYKTKNVYQVLSENGMFNTFPVDAAVVHYLYQFGTTHDWTTKVDILNIYERSQKFNPRRLPAYTKIGADGQKLVRLDKEGNPVTATFDGKTYQVYEKGYRSLVSWDRLARPDVLAAAKYVNEVTQLKATKGTEGYGENYRKLLQKLDAEIASFGRQKWNQVNFKSAEIDNEFIDAANYARATGFKVETPVSDTIETPAITEPVAETEPEMEEAETEAPAVDLNQDAGLLDEDAPTDSLDDEEPDWLSGSKTVKAKL